MNEKKKKYKKYRKEINIERRQIQGEDYINKRFYKEETTLKRDIHKKRTYKRRDYI